VAYSFGKGITLGKMAWLALEKANSMLWERHHQSAQPGALEKAPHSSQPLQGSFWKELVEIAASPVSPFLCTDFWKRIHKTVAPHLLAQSLEKDWCCL